MLLLLCLSMVVGTLSQPFPSNCNIICDAEYKPVCGSDGITYSNKCKLGVASCNARMFGRHIFLIHVGQCGASVQTSGCDQICDEEVHPICATDGKVYSNKCRFILAQCEHAKNHTSLGVLQYGNKCPTPREPECGKYRTDISDLAIEGGLGSSIMTHCPVRHKYVCSSTLASFSNECQLCHYIDHQNIRYEAMHKPAPHITILYDGVCHRNSIDPK